FGSSRRWAEGDVVTLSLLMPASFTWPDPRIAAVRGQVAVERGPLVYCLESADFGEDVESAVIDVSAGLQVEDGEVHATLARRAVTERAWAYASDPSDGVDVADAGQVRLTPYREWGNRGAGPVRVFLPTASVRSGALGRDVRTGPPRTPGCPAVGAPAIPTRRPSTLSVL